MSCQVILQKIIGEHHEERHEPLSEEVYRDLIDDEDLLASVSLSRELQDSREKNRTISLSVFVMADCSPRWISVARTRLAVVAREYLGRLVTEFEEEKKNGLGT